MAKPIPHREIRELLARRPVVTAVLGLIIAAVVVSPLNAAAPTITAPVVRVIDGDTIEVSVNGVPEKVRYIGINSPEIHHPTKGAEPFGQAAKAINRDLVEGKTVTLVFDVQQRDRYGRLLAYVYVGGVFINAEMLRRGGAEVATFPPNVRHRGEFIQLQREAMAANAGLWGDAEARPHYRPRGSGVYGNKRTHSYFHVDDPQRQALYFDEWQTFDSAQEAAKAGYEPSFHYAGYQRDEYVQLAGSSSSASGGSSSGYSGSFGSGLSGGSDVNVRGYTRGDGTNVAPYTRGAPGSGGGGSRGGGGRR